jgi:hypothetical protein
MNSQSENHPLPNQSPVATINSHPEQYTEQVGSAKVYKNFLDRETFEEIQKAFLSPAVPWSYNSYIIVSENPNQGPDLNTFQFTHGLFHDGQPTSPGFDLIKPILDKIKPEIILRVKANLTPRNNEHIIGGFHVDTNEPCTTAVFYLNTNNGYTMFEDGTKVPSAENTLVEFESDNKHTGVGQTDTQVRLVLNLNYIR